MAAPSALGTTRRVTSSFVYNSLQPREVKLVPLHVLLSLKMIDIHMQEERKGGKA